MTTHQPSQPVFVIGGVYEYRGNRVVLTGFDPGSSQWVEFCDNGESTYVDGKELTGPIAMPCPICVRLIETSILGAHMMGPVKCTERRDIDTLG